jgi:hydroxyacylglutathione hydrolase
MALIFEVIRGGGDNLAYIIGCSSEKVAAVVDPVAAHSILDFCENKKLKILYVLNTHGHPDHTAGNDVIAGTHGAKILAHKGDRITSVHQILNGGETIEVGKIKINVIHTPGHTEGSVCFRVNNKLLSGDTMFLAGAGNTRFGGNIKDLFMSFNDKLLPLADKVEIYPGHDYAESNLGFARTIEPENVAIDQKMKALKETVRSSTFIKSTMKEEKLYNPFLRYSKPELIESLKSEYPELSSNHPLEIFRQIRELRNNW